MPFSDLQSFITALEQNGQTRRVDVEVDPILEISEIANRVCKLPCPEGDAGAPPTDPVHGGRGGYGLVFSRVKGSRMPVAINLYGSYARMRLALGCESFEELADRVQRLIKPQPPTTLIDKLKMLPELAKLANYAPKRVRNGPCQEVVHTDDADLTTLPIIKCWPHDGGADEAVIASQLGASRAAAACVPIAGSPDAVAPSAASGLRATTGCSDAGASRAAGSRVPTAGSSDADAVAPSAASGRRAVPDYSDAGATLGSPGAGTTPSVAPGRYITLASILTTAPDGAEPNLGMYRVQLTGPRSAIFHCHVHHDGARHLRLHAAQGRDMPVALIFGGESVLPYAATCPLPPSVSEMLFAGFLNDGGIPVVPAKTIPLDVPANAEIVVEGWVSATETAREGPFGDHTGFYSLAERCHVMRVTAITHRREPIYPTTIVGPPPMEDYYLGKATERVFLPLLQMLIPELMDYHLPQWGAFHNICFVKIRKAYPYQARKVASSIWGAGQMMFSKFIIVVDEDVNVHDEQAVMFAVGANVDPRRDTFLVDGPMDILDHAAPSYGAGSKMGIDATRKMQGEGMVRDWPMPLSMSEDVRRLVDRRWREYGLP